MSEPGLELIWLDDEDGNCRHCGNSVIQAGTWKDWVLVECGQCGLTGPTGRIE